MTEDSKPDESAIDDSTVTHDQAKAIEEAKESHDKAPELPEPGKTNTKGIGVAEMESSREKHPFVE